MPTRWTTGQQKAIDVRGVNTLVSAAAGSGKTAVLVERVIKRITDEENPVMINRMLIVTFTNAAAAEMRERIYQALIDEIDKNPESNNLKKQLILLGQAQITTVHAFCQNLIRSNFHRLGISMDFEIADESVTADLKNTAMEEVLEEFYQAMPTGFGELVDNFGGKRDDSRLIETILKIYNFIQSTPDPSDWLKKAKAMYDIECSDSNSFITDTWGIILLQDAKLKLSGIIEQYNECIDIILENDEISKYYEVFTAEKDRFKTILSVCDRTWDEMYYSLLNEVFEPRLPTRPKNTSDEAAKIVQSQRNGIKKVFGDIKKVFSVTADSVCEENKTIKNVINILCELISAFSERYYEKKQNKNLLDFNDLEHLAIKLLEDEDFAIQVKNRFDEVLVDEYQDTNGVQAKIFETVSCGNNLFMVGDVKQSIYSFRNARPDSFIEKYNTYSDDENTNGVKIKLLHNFRSCEKVIDFVNFIFDGIMSSKVGDVNYKEERLVYGNKDIESIENPVEFHVLEANIEEDSELEDELLQLDKDSKEAIFTAKRIIQLVQIEKPLVYDKSINQKRPIKYSDIAVLMRKTTGVSEIYAEQFSLAGIPVYVEETGGFFASIEIATIMSFLQMIDNPLIDIPLIAVMRSPMFGFSDNELAEIRGMDKHRPFYNAVKKCKTEKAVNFITTLQKFMDEAKHESIAFIINKILTETGYYIFAGTLPGGKKRMTNLRMLYEKASQFEKDRKRTIFSFINYIKAMTENGYEYKGGKLVGENDDVVKIMSIHKSKGLEFPVVFLVKCGLLFNKTDVSNQILYDLDMGLGTDVVNGFCKYPSIPKMAIARKKQSELLSEEMRILYVALTRAKEKLVIVGTAAKAKEKLINWENISPTPFNLSRLNSYLDWLGIVAFDIAKVHSYESVLLNETEIVKNEKISGEAPPEIIDEINSRLSYRYIYSYAKEIPSKLSVSEIAEGETKRINLLDIKTDYDKGVLSAAERGTIIHFFLQNIKLKQYENAAEINFEIEKMVNSNMLLKEQAKYIDANSIFEFFSSDLGKRMLKSNDVRREFKFFVDIPSNEILGNQIAQNDDTILIQGVIDCCFEEDGKFIIIDYKTGSMREEYKKQLEIYKMCLSKVTGKEVSEALIYPLI